MDNLTHTAIGLFLSRAGMNRWTPRATPILLLASNAPDLDVVTAAWGGVAYLNYHRHVTHAFMAMPLMAILPVLLVRLATRKEVNWRGAFVASFIAVGTHLALDWTNIYGIRLLLPFSGEWFRADITSVVDLWIWAALLLGIAGPFLSKLVNTEIGAGPGKRAYGRGWAWFALLFVLLYNGARWNLHGRATAVLESRLYQGEPPVRALAIPSPFNPLAWRGVVETRESFSVHRLSLLREFDPDGGTVFHKSESSAVIDAARKNPVFSDFLSFSQITLLRVLPVAEPDGGSRVDAIDMRFGTPAEPGFMASATLNSRLEVVTATFRFGAVRPR